MVYAILSGAVLFLVDRWSKKLVQLHVTNGFVACGSFLRIRYVTHLRGCYGQPSVRIGLLLFWFASLLCAVGLRRLGWWSQNPSAFFGLGLAFGGAAGNLVDIWQHGHIVNFVDLRVWPVFNLADLGIVVGLLVALLT